MSGNLMTFARLRSNLIERYQQEPEQISRDELAERLNDLLIDELARENDPDIRSLMDLRLGQIKDHWEQAMLRLPRAVVQPDPIGLED